MESAVQSCLTGGRATLDSAPGLIFSPTAIGRTCVMMVRAGTEMKDLYAVLNVSRDADEAAIALHTDSWLLSIIQIGIASEMQREIQKVKLAYDVLGNPERRVLYDPSWVNWPLNPDVRFSERCDAAADRRTRFGDFCLSSMRAMMGSHRLMSITMRDFQSSNLVRGGAVSDRSDNHLHSSAWNWRRLSPFGAV